ncbi:thionin-like isoform X2 [Humulus lupulus]|uniref:thionin-like isoform X2 n=1 Tax=Humulus lupulus TaxID=3486 RepID=UPI002B40B9F3|nr:thionin-like isoform X2 [Humulus lupulus]
MEGKTVFMTVLLLSLVVGQIQVEAKSCCPTTDARNLYDTCDERGVLETVCASLSGCQIISGSTCPTGYENDILKNPGDAVKEYCKLGCASSVCGAITTLQNFANRLTVKDNSFCGVIFFSSRYVIVK